MKKILLPTDFSSNAYNAITYALKLFKDEECTFYLLNTYSPVIYDTEYIGYTSVNPGLDEIYKKNSETGLEKLEEKIINNFPNSKHHFTHISSFNLLADEINEQVENEDIDLVIMGTQGATGAKEVLFGSTTVRVIHHAKIPVLAIPVDYKFTPLSNILFPTDYEIEYTDEQMHWIKKFCSKYQSTVNILHVLTHTVLQTQHEKAKARLEHHFKKSEHEFYEVDHTNVSKAVYNFQKEHPIDMLVMINNKHSFFENLFFQPVIDEIGFHTKVPFLVIPSGNK